MAGPRRRPGAADLVFSFGGIGATPDDHTRQAAAAALGVALVRHPEAVAELEARGGEVHAIIGARSRSRLYEDEVLNETCASIAVMTTVAKRRFPYRITTRCTARTAK